MSSSSWERGGVGVAMLVGVTLGGCATPEPPTIEESNVALAGLSDAALAQFNRGKALVSRVFTPNEGLGPLYIEASCASCHEHAGRGPGKVTRMAVETPEGEAVYDRALAYGTVVRPHACAGATHGVVPPTGIDGRMRLSFRVGPPLYGRGRIEAIADRELLEEEARQARAGIVSGRANKLADGTVGHLGLKARIATLDGFAADAFHGDMGLTSSKFPDELPNPDGVKDDLLHGVDVDDATIADIAAYLRTLAMPAREGLTQAGAKLFESTGCLNCHTNSYRTRADYPVPALANLPADIYSDLLLHDLGTWEADGVADVNATGREWRTAPLVGMRFFSTYLHDGRSTTLDDCIRKHAGEGSEANFSVHLYKALSAAQQKTLVDYVRRL